MSAYQPNPISAHDYERKWQAHAREEFAPHVVRALPHDMGWTFSRANSGNHAGEIVLCRYACILVHGDCPDVMYQGGHYDNPQSRLSWLGGSNLDYLAGKVRLGKAESYDEEVALWWLLDHIKDADDDMPDDDDPPDDATSDNARLTKRIEGLREAEDMLRRGDGEDELRRFLYEEVFECDGEAVEHFGKVVSSDVIWTTAAASHVWKMVGDGRVVT